MREMREIESNLGLPDETHDVHQRGRGCSDTDDPLQGTDMRNTNPVSETTALEHNSSCISDLRGPDEGEDERIGGVAPEEAGVTAVKTQVHVVDRVKAYNHLQYHGHHKKCTR